MSCPNVQDALNGYFINSDPSRYMEPAPLYEFLWSDMNRAGFKQLQNRINPAPGKIMNVNVEYFRRIPESDVQTTSSCDRDCSSTTKRGDGIATYTIDPCVKYMSDEQISAQQFFYSCTGNGELAMGVLMRNIDAAVRKAATALTGQACALYGKYSDDAEAAYTVTSDELVIATKKATSGDPDIYGMGKIDNALMMTGYMGAPVIFSGITLYEYIQALKAGCCASSGVNLEAILANHGKAVLWDRRVQSSSGLNSINKALAVQPGALQAIYFNEYETDPIIDGALQNRVGKNYETFVLRDPRTNTPVNVLISDNCGVVSIFVHVCAKVVGMPTDMFMSGDNMNGVTWVNKILVTNP